jgi:hypothetical protein
MLSPSETGKKIIHFVLQITKILEIVKYYYFGWMENLKGSEPIGKKIQKKLVQILLTMLGLGYCVLFTIRFSIPVQP